MAETIAFADDRRVCPHDEGRAHMGGRRDEERDARGRISRRAFLGYSAAAGAATAASSMPALASTGGRGVDVPEFEWDGATIADLQRAMERGGNSSRRIVQDHIDRINEIDLHGPRLNSVIEINPDALAIADARDRERRDGHVRGPLHGGGRRHRAVARDVSPSRSC
jgi:hypothetical protein